MKNFYEIATEDEIYFEAINDERSVIEELDLEDIL